jgi:hypothetical protein
MRHRTEKYKQKETRKNPNKERIVDVRSKTLDTKYIKEKQNKSQDKTER